MKTVGKTNVRWIKLCFTIAGMIVLAAYWVNPGICHAEELNLGMVGPSPSKMIKRFGPLMDYLKEKGLPAGKVVTAKTLDQMIGHFKSGKVAFLFESAYGTIRVMDEANGVPILIREKKGVREYNSVIFVKKDSPIGAMPDLNGKIVAFEDPTSTSSYMMPRKLLETAGLVPEESRNRKPVPGKLAYYFTSDDENTIVHVKAGRADAGGIKKGKVENDPEFRLLSPESAFVPRHVVTVRKDVEYDKLKSVLLNMKKDTVAVKVLEAIRTPTGFSEFDGNATEVMNTKIREALGI